MPPVDAAAREAFARDGFVVLKGVLDRARIDALVAAGDALIASDEPFYRDREDGADGFRHLVELDPAFRPLIAEPRVLAFALDVLGTNIHFSSSHLSHLQPRANRDGWKSHWHTDVWGVEDDLGSDGMVRLGLKCCYFLTDHEAGETGATMVVPGSHLLRERLVIPPGAMNPVDATEPTLAAGDCLVFDLRLRHSVGINLSAATRKSILVGYSYRWVIPLDEPSDPDGLRDELDPVAADLIPRAYRVPQSGALLEFAQREGIPARPTRRIP